MNSHLYRRLGLTGPLLDIQCGGHNIGDNAYSVSIHHGTDGLSDYEPSTITVDTPANVTQTMIKGMAVKLTPAAAAQIAALGNVAAADIEWRFNGRVGQHTARDTKDGWKGTTVTGAAWSSVLPHSPDTLTPTAGLSFQEAAETLFQPAWETRSTFTWLGRPDEWPTITAPAEGWDPITADDLLGILADRLYTVTNTRAGDLVVQTSQIMRAAAEDAAEDGWPLARDHVIAPTTWESPTAYPTTYQMTILELPNEDPFTFTVGDGDGRTVSLDWTDYLTRSPQWMRFEGLWWAATNTNWRLKSLTVPIDHLLASPREYDRHVAGQLLALNTGDPIPLAGDWPTAVDGVYYVTGIDEQITPDGWTLTLALVPFPALVGLAQLAVPPRVWHQSRGFWNSQNFNRTWQEGAEN